MPVHTDGCLPLVLSDVLTNIFVVDVVGTFDDFGGSKTSRLRARKSGEMGYLRSVLRTFWMLV